MKLASLAQDPLQQQSKEALCGSCRPSEVVTGTFTLNIIYWNIIG